MAEKDRKPESAASAPPSEKKGPPTHGNNGGLLNKTPVLLGGVMLLEAAVLFAGFKFLGSGVQPAQAELVVAETGHGQGAATGEKPKWAEVPVVDLRAPNKRSGRTFIYDVSIFLVSKGEFEEKAKKTIKEREALIKDRIRTIIADSDPEKLGGGIEPGLETLRRQVKHQLDEILGEGMIEEVLVPRCIPFRTDF